MIENSNFEGLGISDVSYLKSYLHARPPQQKWNTNLLTRPDYNYALDFLDTIDMDVPSGMGIKIFFNNDLKSLLFLWII